MVSALKIILSIISIIISFKYRWDKGLSGTCSHHLQGRLRGLSLISMGLLIYFFKYLLIFGYYYGIVSSTALNRDVYLLRRQQPDDGYGNPNPADCRDAWNLVPHDQLKRWYYGGSRGDLPNEEDIKPLEVLPREWAMGNCVVGVSLAFDIGGAIGPQFDETNWQTLSEMADSIISIVVVRLGKGGFGYPGMHSYRDEDGPITRSKETIRDTDTWMSAIVTRTAHIKVEVFEKHSAHDRKAPAALAVEDDGVTSTEAEDLPTPPGTVNIGPSYVGPAWPSVKVWMEATQDYWGQQGQCRAVYCTYDRDCAHFCGDGFKCGGGDLLKDVAAALINFGAMMASSLGVQVCSSA